MRASPISRASTARPSTSSASTTAPAWTCARGLSIADAHADARVATFPSTRDIGISAYTGVALYRPDGTLYGTLCALWPRPRAVLTGETALLALTGRVIMGARARESLLVERAAAAAREDAWRTAHDRLQEVLIVTGHELRTPLTTVTAAVQLARQRLAGSAADRLLEQAASGARRLARIVDDALELAHAEAGVPVTPQEAGACDVGALVAEVVADLRLAWPRRAITLDRPAEGGPLPVRANPDRLARAITNLLGNALKYSSPECPVTVVARRDGAEARVEVRDEGPGIPPDEHGRLWERFHRVAGTVVRDGSGVGLGLGLYLVRSIVEAHGGRVGLESVPGRGSTFWFTAPLTADPLDDDAV